MLASIVFWVLAAAAVLLLGTGFTARRFLLQNQSACSMTYSKHEKTPVKVNSSLEYKDYQLFMFGPKKKSAASIDIYSTPVLFIPGHGGSADQGRSLASQMLNTDSSFTYFAVDFAKSYSAVQVEEIIAQAAFVNDCLQRIVDIYDKAAIKKGFSSSNATVAIVGHSLGGTVARLAPMLQNHPESCPVSQAILLAAPSDRAPFGLDTSMETLFHSINNGWKNAHFVGCERLMRSQITTMRSATSSLSGKLGGLLNDGNWFCPPCVLHTKVFSLSGGYMDDQVHEDWTLQQLSTTVPTNVTVLQSGRQSTSSRAKKSYIMKFFGSLIDSIYLPMKIVEKVTQFVMGTGSGPSTTTTTPVNNSSGASECIIIDGNTTVCENKFTSNITNEFIENQKRYNMSNIVINDNNSLSKKQKELLLYLNEISLDQFSNEVIPFYNTFHATYRTSSLTEVNYPCDHKNIVWCQEVLRSVIQAMKRMKFLDEYVKYLTEKENNNNDLNSKSNEINDRFAHFNAMNNRNNLPLLKFYHEIFAMEYLDPLFRLKNDNEVEKPELNILNNFDSKWAEYLKTHDIEAAMRGSSSKLSDLEIRENQDYENIVFDRFVNNRSLTAMNVNDDFIFQVSNYLMQNESDYQFEKYGVKETERLLISLNTYVRNEKDTSIDALVMDNDFRALSSSWSFVDWIKVTFVMFAYQFFNRNIQLIFVYFVVICAQIVALPYVKSYLSWNDIMSEHKAYTAQQRSASQSNKANNKSGGDDCDHGCCAPPKKTIVSATENYLSSLTIAVFDWKRFSPVFHLQLFWFDLLLCLLCNLLNRSNALKSQLKVIIFAAIALKIAFDYHLHYYDRFLVSYSLIASHIAAYLIAAMIRYVIHLINLFILTLVSSAYNSIYFVYFKIYRTLVFKDARKWFKSIYKRFSDVNNRNRVSNASNIAFASVLMALTVFTVIMKSTGRNPNVSMFFYIQNVSIVALYLTACVLSVAIFLNPLSFQKHKNSEQRDKDSEEHDDHDHETEEDKYNAIMVTRDIETRFMQTDAVILHCCALVLILPCLSRSVASLFRISLIDSLLEMRWVQLNGFVHEYLLIVFGPDRLNMVVYLSIIVLHLALVSSYNENTIHFETSSGMVRSYCDDHLKSMLQLVYPGISESSDCNMNSNNNKDNNSNSTDNNVDNGKASNANSIISKPSCIHEDGGKNAIYEELDLSDSVSPSVVLGCTYRVISCNCCNDTTKERVTDWCEWCQCPKCGGQGPSKNDSRYKTYLQTMEMLEKDRKEGLKKSGKKTGGSSHGLWSWFRHSSETYDSNGGFGMIGYFLGESRNLIFGVLDVAVIVSGLVAFGIAVSLVQDRMYRIIYIASLFAAIHSGRWLMKYV